MVCQSEPHKLWESEVESLGTVVDQSVTAVRSSKRVISSIMLTQILTLSLGGFTPKTESQTVVSRCWKVKTP